MESWSFLTNHARVLVCIAHDPGARLRDIADSMGITERSAHAIVTDLTQAGYVVKERDGRRNRYQIEAHLPLPEPGTRAPAIGEVLALLLGRDDDGEDLGTGGRMQMSSPPGSAVMAPQAWWTAGRRARIGPKATSPGRRRSASTPGHGL
jgi:hypothetical protein